MHQSYNTKGSTVLLVIVFSAVMAVLVSALAGIVISQAKLSRAKEARERAVHVADAGLNYYQWFLNQYPTDTQDGTGQPGPYVHQYDDPETGRIGEFSLDVTGNVQCGQLQSVDIASTGSVDTHPTYTRTVSARYMKPTVAEYAQMFGTPAWFGASSSTIGLIHSNSGVRMDGTHNSAVRSAVSTWTCTSAYGCSPDSTQNGVFGSGGDDALWQFPVASINFTTIGSAALATKAYAQSSGVYLGTFSGNNDAKGYHLIFQSNGTVDVYRVTASDTVWAYSSTYGTTYSSNSGWRQVHDNITTETYLGNYTISSTCSLIFSEEKLWIEGVVGGRVTVVASNSGAYNPDVLLKGNITYATGVGTDGLNVIAEDYVLFPYNAPEDQTVYGVFTAVKGRFGRDYYDAVYVGAEHALKDSLTIVGTVVSNKSPGLYWSCSGTPCSGFITRNYYYDAGLIANPPPFTSTISDVSRFYTWREE